MRSHVKDKSILLVFGDLTAMVAAFLCALYLGNNFSFLYAELLKNSIPVLMIILPIPLVLFVLDAYSLEKTSLTFIRQSLTIINGLVLSASAMTFIFFLFRSSFSRKVFILFYILSAILIIILRYILSQKAKPEKSNVLVVGSGEICNVLEDIINTHGHLHSRIVGLLSDNPLDHSACDCSQLGRIDNLLSVVKSIRS